MLQPATPIQPCVSHPEQKRSKMVNPAKNVSPAESSRILSIDLVCFFLDKTDKVELLDQLLTENC